MYKYEKQHKKYRFFPFEKSKIRFVRIYKIYTKTGRKYMRKLALDDEILLSIEKPARYIGNEVNSIMKNKNEVGYPFRHVFSGCLRDRTCRNLGISDFV